MAASPFNATYHADSTDVNCSLCIEKFTVTTNNGHEPIPTTNVANLPLALTRFNNNNGFYGNGASTTSSMMLSGQSISPDHSDNGRGSSVLWANLLKSLDFAPETTKSPSPPSELSRLTCNNCEDGGMGMYQCRDCNEVLCEHCKQAHQRVRLTKDHYIVHLSSQGSLPSPGDSPDSLSLAHTPPPTTALALPQPMPLVTSSFHITREVEEAIDLITATAKAVERRAATVAAEIRGLMRELMKALIEREQDLILRVERVTLNKTNVLRAQAEALKLHLRVMTTSSPPTPTSTSPSSPTASIPRPTPILIPCEEDTLLFTANDVKAVLSGISTLGCITSSGCADLTIASGEGLKRGVRGRPSMFTVRVFDHLGEPRTCGRDIVSVLIADQNARTFAGDVQDRGDGSYAVTYRPRREGVHLISVLLRGRPIRHSPFQAIVSLPNVPFRPLTESYVVRNGRNYTSIGEPLLVFGEEGEGDGEVCRPWGITCDKEGRIVLADRSNNRIQVFEADGTFRHKFGSHGCSPGQFDRPAGVSVDALGRIVVADKDNHRIQIFTFEGVFLLKFGEKGSKPGQFNYPWDVDTDPDSRIVVSDTRNHRVQLFDENGNYLCKYGFESVANMWKHFDSPRGVCWSPDQRVIVTDFNNHRLVVIDPDFLNARFLGGEGTQVKQFLRPQGVAVDDEGHIIVADSRNHRVQIFEPNGGFVWKFGSPGTEPGELDRPAGLCLTPDGRIVVVDFGNSRIQIF